MTRERVIEAIREAIVLPNKHFGAYNGTETEITEDDPDEEFGTPSGLLRIGINDSFYSVFLDIDKIVEVLTG